MKNLIKIFWDKNPCDDSGEWTWWYRIAIIVRSLAGAFAVAYGVYYAFLETCFLPYKLRINEVFTSASVILAFTLTNGFGIWLIRTHDQKKQFRDTYKQQSELLFSNAYNILLQKDPLPKPFALKELLRLKSEKAFMFEMAESAIRHSDLSETNLAKMNLQGENLTGVVLKKANLEGAILKSIKLGGADLSGAKLSGSDLSGATLVKANLTGAALLWADLSGADLTGAQLSAANLAHANLSNAILTNVDLTDITTDSETKFNNIKFDPARPPVISSNKQELKKILNEQNTWKEK